MSTKVNLNEVIEAIDMQFETSENFLNVKTGKIVVVSSDALRSAEDDEPFDHLPEWQQEDRIVAIDIIDNFEDYKTFPTKYEINEYDIMENFCLSITNERKREILLRSIRGKGAFRRFKDTIIDLEIADQWYSYRDERYKQIAIEWCRDNDINFVE